MSETTTLQEKVTDDAFEAEQMTRKVQQDKGGAAYDAARAEGASPVLAARTSPYMAFAVGYIMVLSFLITLYLVFEAINDM